MRRGRVVDTRAPDGSLRARVSIQGVNDGVPVDQLPWAEYKLDMSFTFKPAQVGDEVWVEFPYDGDTRRPLITGGAMSSPGGIPNVSGAASGNAPLEPPTTEGTPPFPPFDPSADLVYDRNGLVIAATAGGGVVVTNRNNGAMLFLSVDGDLCANIPGKNVGYAEGGYDVKTPAIFKVVADSGIELETAALLSLKGGGGISLDTAALLQMLAASIKADKA